MWLLLDIKSAIATVKQKHSFLLWKNPIQGKDPGGIIPSANYGGGGVFIILHLNTYILFSIYTFVLSP